VGSETSRHVFLVGFMGSGKTTAGRELARRKGWEFVDLDHVIERDAARSISTIFREQGEDFFRELESSTLRRMLASRSKQSRVVALGGGAFAQPENVSVIAQTGATVIFLDAPVVELLRRCRQQTEVERPLLGNEAQFERLYEQRRPRYLAGDRTVDTHGRTVAEVVDEIERYLEV
jgi:shikimate kinase